MGNLIQVANLVAQLVPIVSGGIGAIRTALRNAHTELSEAEFNLRWQAIIDTDVVRAAIALAASGGQP